MKQLKKLSIALAISALFATGAAHATILDLTTSIISSSGDVAVSPNLANLSDLSGFGGSTLTMNVSNISSFDWLFTSQTPFSWNPWETWFEKSYVSINGGSQILLADVTSLANSGTYYLGAPFSGTLAFGFESTYFANMNDYSQSSLSIQNVAAVPEPETYAMLLAGLGLLGFTARRRKNLYA